MTHSFFFVKVIFDGQSQNRYRKLVDAVVCSNNVCTKGFYRYTMYYIVHSSTCLGPR